MNPYKPHWLYCEDLAAALVGPFKSRAAAETHIKQVTEPRGDADPGKILTDAEAQVLMPEVKLCGLVMTPAKDRDWIDADDLYDYPGPGKMMPDEPDSREHSL